MIKTRLFCFFVYLLSYAPSMGQAFNFLESQKLKQGIQSNGVLFQDKESKAAFFFPAQSQNPLVKFSGIWVSATDTNSISRASILKNNNENDFTYGPLSITAPKVDSQWDRVSILKQNTIEDHILRFKESGYVADENILNWPCNAPFLSGNILASFVDWNANLIYEPLLGEYPILSGNQSAYLVYNDWHANRTAITSSPIGVEIKHEVYTKENIPNLLHSSFHRVLVTNKNNINFKALKLGIYLESNIGEGQSEFVRSLPSQNSVLIYSTKQTDSFYGAQIPAVVVQFLSAPLAGSIYLTQDNDLVTGMPQNVEEVNNLLSGRWTNGKRLTYGGNGVDGSNQARFIYPGLEDDENQQFDWTEEKSGNLPGVRNVLLRFDSLSVASNQTKEFIFVYHIIEDFKVAEMGKLKDFLNTVDSLFDKGGITKTQATPRPDIRIYPNPLQQGQEIHLEGLQNTSISVYQSDGKLVKEMEVKNSVSSVKLNLKPGIYWFKVHDPNQRAAVHKVIVIE
jgi:hypothetical protein